MVDPTITVGTINTGEPAYDRRLDAIEARLDRMERAGEESRRNADRREKWLQGVAVFVAVVVWNGFSSFSTVVQSVATMDRYGTSYGRAEGERLTLRQDQSITKQADHENRLKALEAKR